MQTAITKYKFEVVAGEGIPRGDAIPRPLIVTWESTLFGHGTSRPQTTSIRWQRPWEDLVVRYHGRIEVLIARREMWSPWVGRAFDMRAYDVIVARLHMVYL